LITDLKEQFNSEVDSGKLTIKTNSEMEINFKASTITINKKEYSIGPVGVAAQELVIEEGLENWVKNRL
jgi:hypothetical protein